MTVRRWLVSYWLWMALLAVAFYALPSWHILIWSTIGLTSAGAGIVGVVRNRPRQVTPWVLLSIALFCFAAGDTTYNLLTSVAHQVDPFPSPADLFYLVTCVSQIAGVFLLVRARTASRDRTSIIDSVVLTSGVGLIYWIFLISPDVQRQDLTVLEKIISIAYPLSDVLVLALVARLLVVARRSPAVLLLATGTAGLLVADVAYGLIQLHANWIVGGPVDFGWIVLYATWGAAALHPSMVSLTEPRIARPAQMGRPRLILLALSSLVAPATLMIEAARGHVHDAEVIAALSALVFLLVLTRLAGAVNTHRRAEARERGLRHAADALVSATDATEVRTAVHAAVAYMLPAGTDHRVVLTMADSARLGAARPTGSYPSLDQLGDGRRAAQLRYANSLDPVLARSLHGFDLCLLCPLTVPDRPSGDPRLGSLMVAADEEVLAVLQGPVEVLASQASLALERIILTDEVNRRENEEYFRTLVQNTADVILIVEEDNRVRYASPSASSVFGNQPVVGVALEDLLEADDRGHAVGLLELVGPGNGGDPGDSVTDWAVRHPDGTLVQVEAFSQDLRQDHTVRGVVITLRDVTERRRLEEELTHRAFHDSLTGLANRVLFQERVRTAVLRAQPRDSIVGVLFIDLDDFKVVNDTMGHHTGDQLLFAVGQRLSSVLRPQDSAARLGGDEFAALIEDVRDPAEVEAIATRIVTVLSEPFTVGDALVSGNSSIGVATTAEALDEHDLLRQADLALYAAKGAGKGQWRRYQAALHTAILKRMEIRTELDQAVKDWAFELLYQPIVALSDGETLGFEALLRWKHPTQGVVKPAEFIQIAEESGLIVPIGDWVLRTGIDAAVGWERPGLSAPVYVSINVSVRQFRTPGFVDKVCTWLTAAGLPPSRLMLEITESLLLPDEVQVWSDLSALRALGVRIAIDDFGTGHSSLSYLRRVPVDVVKVDRSFVETIGSSPQQRSLVKGIVWLTGALGLQVIAEGIESETDRNLLKRLGCPMGQGYHFAPPLSYQDSVEWLATERIAA